MYTTTRPAAMMGHSCTQFGGLEEDSYGLGRASLERIVTTLRLGLTLICAVSVTSAFGCAPEDDARTVRKRIGPSGGQVSSHDGVLTVLILPGALEREHEFIVTPSDTPPLIFGPAYRVQPDIDLAINAEVTYARRLPNDPTGTAVAAIHREDFKANAGSWIKLATVELDVEDDLVTATDSEVSMFYGLLEGDDISGTTSSTTVVPTTQGETGDSAESGSDTGSDTISLPLSHATDIAPIWALTCQGSECHAAGANVPDLETNPYAAIVEVMPLSAAVPYVTPGDPQLSYLWHKLAATHALDANLGGCGCGGSGNPMPSGGLTISDADKDTIFAWIEEGAEP